MNISVTSSEAVWYTSCVCVLVKTVVENAVAPNVDVCKVITVLLPVEVVVEMSVSTAVRI